MHAQGYFGKIQQSYINPHKSLHFVKNEQSLPPSPTSTPPLSKPWKRAQKIPSPSSYLEADTPLKVIERFNIKFIYGVFGLGKRFERVDLFGLGYLILDLWEKFIELCEWCYGCVKIFYFLKGVKCIL